MQLHQVPDDGEPQPEARVLSCGSALALPESLENVREEMGAMPIPVSLTTISTLEFTRSIRTWMRPCFGVNFTAFIIRFQTICRRRSGSPETGPTCGSKAVST
jgi:hypothetical protein